MKLDKDFLKKNNADLYVGKECSDAFVWRFENAPEFLQNLSENGGDENWVVLIKTELWESYYGNIHWVDVMGEPQIFEIGEWMIVIGSHG